MARANLLEQQEAGVALCEPQTVYWSASDWETLRPWLDRVSLAELSKETGISERRLREYRQGARKARPERVAAITEALAPLIEPRDG